MRKQCWSMKMCGLSVVCLVKIECESEPARDCGVTSNEDVKYTGLFASKLVPTEALWGV
jgi:hypothetical protein